MLMPLKPCPQTQCKPSKGLKASSALAKKAVITASSGVVELLVRILGSSVGEAGEHWWLLILLEENLLMSYRHCLV